MLLPLLALAVALLALVAPWFARRERTAGALGFGLTSVACALVAGIGIDLVLRQEAWSLELPASVPGVHLALRADALSGVFLAILGVGGAAASLYATSYVKPHADHVPLAAQTTLFAGFLLSIALVFVANDGVVFLVAWETMSVLSYLLILTHEQDDATRHAANTYLLMMHIGTAFLLVSLVALAGAAGGTYGFDAMRALARGAPESVRSIAFVGAAVGFGTKAGLVPLHAWLPEAHPAAPSHVSALMSGVMLKTAVYMMIRVSLDLLGGGPAWWGITLLVLGGVTTLTGILYATSENDLKRLLAYSSVENLGVIFMGLGLSLLFLSYGHPALATLPLIAAVLHSLNHMTFKTLLFLGSGSVLHATGTRDINRLGGLVRAMPYTAALVLLASLAISALPPLNGFASEWLLFQSLLAGVTLPETPLLLQIFLPVGAGLFALAGAISVVCFVKAFGITFLATPRSPEAERAREAPRTMLLGMGILAAGIVLIAAAAGLVIRVLHGALAPLVGADPTTDLVSGGLVVQSLTAIKASMSPTLVFALVVLFALAAWLGTRLLGSRAAARREETWLCGHRNLSARMEYTGTTYAEATRMFFSGLYGPVTSSRREERSPGVTARLSYATRTTYYIEQYAYAPTARLILLTSTLFRRIQAGNIHAYLSYIFASLVLVLLWATG
jgi:hydrogenase-4 component B